MLTSLSRSQQNVHHFIKLLTLDQSSETLAVAIPLQQKLSGNSFAQPVDISSKSDQAAFDTTRSPEDATAFALLGHANKVSMGDYKSAEEIVAKLTRDFTHKFPDPNAKLAVQHLYVFGCEASLPNGRGRCLAQELADRLHKKGFSNIVVHAVAPPEKLNSKYTSMRVAVARNNSHALSGEYVGHVKAFVLTTAADKELQQHDQKVAQLEREFKTPGKTTERSHRLKADLENAIEARDIFMREAIAKGEIKIFFSTNNSVRKLQKTKNTFIPAASDIEYVPPAIALTVEKLKIRLQALKQKQEEKKKSKADYKINLLENLIDELLTTETILKPVKAAKETIEKTDKLTHHGSSTYKLLCEIYQAELSLVKQDDIIKRLKTVAASKTEEHEIKKPAKSISAQSSNITHDAPKKKPTREKKTSPRFVPPVERKMPQSVSESIVAMRKYARELHYDYNNDGWLAKHTWDKIKLHKAARLIAVADAFEAKFNHELKGQSDEVIQAAFQAEIKNLFAEGKVIQGIFSHRTKYLLLNILAGNPEQYTAAPQKAEQLHEGKALLR